MQGAFDNRALNAWFDSTRLAEVPILCDIFKQLEFKNVFNLKVRWIWRHDGCLLEKAAFPWYGGFQLSMLMFLICLETL